MYVNSVDGHALVLVAEGLGGELDGVADLLVLDVPAAEFVPVRSNEGVAGLGVGADVSDAAAECADRAGMWVAVKRAVMDARPCVPVLLVGNLEGGGVRRHDFCLRGVLR